MIRQSSVTVVIPVRGGSEAYREKSLSSGEPFFRTCNTCALRSNFVDNVIVSTDDEEMFCIAKQYGVASKYLRPSYLSNDTASTIIIKHEITQANISNSWIVLLQVTTPLRTSFDFANFLTTFQHQLTSLVLQV